MGMAIPKARRNVGSLNITSSKTTSQRSIQKMVPPKKKTNM